MKCTKVDFVGMTGLLIKTEGGSLTFPSNKFLDALKQ